MIKKYLDFRTSTKSTNESLLVENVNQAKTYLRNKALTAKKEKMGGGEGEKIGLTPDEVRRADTDPNFVKIRQMLSDSPLVYVFTKFFYEDLSEMEPNERFAELDALNKKLKDMRSSLSNLPMPVERYVSKAANDEEKSLSEKEGRQYRGAFERLGDDLTKLESGVAYNKWVGQLLSWQKVWMEKLPPVQKSKIEGIAVAFDQFGIEDGFKDKAMNKSLQDTFFIKVKDYKTLNDLIIAAENYVKAANNAGTKKFIALMDKVNKKYGESNGVEIVYSEGDNLIIEVKSFPANVDLNSNTSHCIVRSISYWNTYVGLDKFTKQFYIYDFSLPPSDNYSVIGITIGEGGRITACHLKDDKSFGDKIVKYLKDKGIDIKVMKPMTKEEVELRKRRIVASKEIIKDNLKLDQVKQYLEDGADVNANSGKPLENAVKEDNYEKVSYLLEMGAIPSINNPIKYAKNFDMIKLLVKYNCPITNEVFNSIVGDLDGVKFVLDHGVDPNFEKGFPIRTAARSGNVEVIKLLLKYGANISERRYMVIKQCVENGNVEVLEYLLGELDKNDSGFRSEKSKLIKDWKHWNSSSLQTKPDVKERIDQILESYE